MFDLDTFIDECLTASRADQPLLAVKEVMDRAMSTPAAVADALPPERAELAMLYASDEVTIAKVVWAPGMAIRPHDHRTWASIGIYSGGENNTFFRRQGDGITQSGGKELRPSDVCLLGDDTIHSVVNPTEQFAGAIHVYGGNFMAIQRSGFDPETLEEHPWDGPASQREFEVANAAYDAAHR
jgi:predicted metal-dependent enzyme (double-stranded beta helix superfamily)